jgi:gluconate 2-dehydrogenase gamma chain
MSEISRRVALQTLALSRAVSTARNPSQGGNPDGRTTLTPATAEGPKTFDDHQYSTLRSLCERIIPADERSGGALEASVPELIDLLASENGDYRTRLTGGLQWLDGACSGRYGHDYLGSSPEQQEEILRLIAYRENAAATPGLSSGIAFFTFLRDLTLGGYFTSEVGMKSLPYLGNKFVPVFPACPPLPES